MVLHGCNQDFIAAANVLATISLGHQVDGFRGAANKNDLFCSGGIQEFSRGLAHVFIMLSRAF